MLRRRLLDALESPLPLLFMEATPGSGKRTLIHQWLAPRDGNQAEEEESRVLVDARHVSTDGAGYLRVIWTALARDLGVDPPELSGSDADMAAAAARFLAGVRRPSTVAVLDADHLTAEAFELLLDAADGRLRFVLAGFDLSALMAVANARRIHFAHLDDTDLECSPDETRELMREGGLSPTDEAVAAMQESTHGHAGLITAAITTIPVESASGQVSPDRALAAFLASTPLDAWPSPFARFVVSLVSVPRFSAEEAAIITGNDAAPALLHRLRLLGLGRMAWHPGLQARVFHWSEAIRAVMAPFLREVEHPDDALRRRVVEVAERCGDVELQVATLLELGELQRAEHLLGGWLWDVLPDRGAALWRAMERRAPQTLVACPALLCIRLHVDKSAFRTPESVLAANLAVRALLTTSRREPERRLAALARALELVRIADDREAFVDLAVRARELVMTLPTIENPDRVTPGMVSDLLMLADTLLRSGNSMNAAVFASHALRLIDLDAGRLDPAGERRLFAGRAVLLSSRERGLDDPVDPDAFLAGLQFLRHDADVVAAHLALMWADLDAGDVEAAGAKCQAAIASVANVEDWPILLYVRAWQGAMQGRVEETQSIIAGYRPGHADDAAMEIPESSVNASGTLLSQIVGRPIRHPEFVPPPPTDSGRLAYPRVVHATALIEALTALRSGRPAAARAHLEQAIRVLPRRSLSVFSLARATAEELAQLVELIQDHPAAERLNLEGASTFGRMLTMPAISLSEREREVLEQIRGGATNEAMAKALYLSVNTVKFHRANLMRKLGARNRTELIDAATLFRLL